MSMNILEHEFNIFLWMDQQRKIFPVTTQLFFTCPEQTAAAARPIDRTTNMLYSDKVGLNMMTLKTSSSISVISLGP